MQKDDRLAGRESIDESILNSIPLIVPQIEDINLDRSRALPFDYNKASIIVRADSPIAFLKLLLRRQAYIYCVEPLSDSVEDDLFEFRPVSPEIAVTLNIVRAAKPIHQESSKAFIDFAESYIGSLT